MNGRSAGPRSFNTLQRSHREARLRRLQEARILLLAICALILLLALTGLVFLFCHIGHSVAGGGTSGGSGKVVYTEIDISPTDESTRINLYTGELLLVNAEHPYHFPSIRIEDLADDQLSQYSVMTYRTTVGEHVPFYVLPKQKNYYMLPTAAKAMSQFLTSYYNKTDEALLLSEGYQTESKQSGSNYDQLTGLSANLMKDQGEKLATDSLNKLLNECANYGFIQRFPSNKAAVTGVGNQTGVFRYVGIPHAKYMSANGLTLEEYLDLLKNSYTDAHLLLDENGAVAERAKDARYEIYYIKATDSTVRISVPQNYKYTISGDNVGGFIVTVDLNSPVG